MHVLGQFGHLQSAHQAASANISLCIRLPNFVKIGPSATQMAARASQFYFRFRFSWFRLSGRLKYNYFRFLKTNVRHFGILPPVPIFTFALPSACHFYLSTKFRPNRTIHDRVMTSYSFYKMAAVSHIELFQSYCRPPTKCKWGFQVGPQISTRSDL